MKSCFTTTYLTSDTLFLMLQFFNFQKCPGPLQGQAPSGHQIASSPSRLCSPDVRDSAVLLVGWSYQEIRHRRTQADPCSCYRPCSGTSGGVFASRVERTAGDAANPEFAVWKGCQAPADWIPLIKTAGSNNCHLLVRLERGMPSDTFWFRPHSQSYVCPSNALH